MTIAVLCATRNRPDKFRRMVDSAFATAFNKKNIKIIFYLYTDDLSFKQYPEPTENLLRRIGPDWSSVMAYNYLAEQPEVQDAKLLMVGADDMIFDTPHWDKALLDAYDALENKIHVFSLKDSRDENGTPHPIMTRNYVSALGYFLPPILLHWYADSWTVEIAKFNNCFTHLKDYLLIHDKPSDHGGSDDTHNRIRLMGWHRRDSFVAQKCSHYLEMDKSHLNDVIQVANGSMEHLD